MTSEEIVASEAPAKPNRVVQAAVRFASVYFTVLLLPWPFSALFVSDQLQGVSDLLVSSVVHVWKPLVDFAATHIFHVGQPVRVAFTDTGSGDRLFDWILNFWVLIIATVATAVWTLVRPDDSGRTSTYLRIYLRYTLGAIMLTYGALKLSQFPPPFFSVLNKTFGEETPMGLLWTFIGASTGYTVFIGVLEVLCGVLLLFRRTTLLGACLAFALTLNIFLLDVFYDVPVKLFSFHLLLASLILLAPDFGRLAGVFVLNRPVMARSEAPLARSRAWGVVLLVLKILFVVDLLGWDAVAAVEGYAKRAAPKSAIEGIWKVDSFQQGGQEVGDSDGAKPVRWQWMTIDKFGKAAVCHLWLVDGSVVSGKLKEGADNEMTFPGEGEPLTWSFQLQGRDALSVDGVVSGRPTSIRLHRDEAWASLVHHQTHWIQDAPREP